MKEGIEEQILQYLFRFEVRAPETAEARPADGPPAEEGSAASRRAAAELSKKQKRRQSDLTLQGAFDPTSGGDFSVETVRSSGPKVGRNDPCPCGSGKKYKKCHGAHAPEPAGPAA
jgi:preprotein translocase subunit SecA